MEKVKMRDSLTIEWAVAHTPYPGQTVSGDAYLFEPRPAGVLMAVMDGLGHGEKAAVAAQSAVSALQASPDSDVVNTLKLCHQSLISTRGAAVTLGRYDMQRRSLDWIGVGNVTGVVFRKTDGQLKREHLLVRGGIVGYRMPTLRSFTVPVQTGDTVIFTTDGIRSTFTEDLSINLPAQQIADSILAKHNRNTDDALVLVVKFGTH